MLFFCKSLSLSRIVFFEADTKIVIQHITSFNFDNQLADFTIKNEDVKYTVQIAADGRTGRLEIQLNFGFNPEN